MHTLLFLEPGHFHAALTLRASRPGVSDEIFVYASDGPELRDFLALVERFNRRDASPTRWRPVVSTAADPLARLQAERRGDVVVLAGRNRGKARTIRRLHEAGFHVLADKPWLVEPEDLDDIRASLGGRPLAVEIMSGRHAVAARIFKRLVDTREVFGEFRDVEPGIELGGVHHLDKHVDGAPLRRPWWFFDVRVQGSGVVDIPTHLVDQTQWLASGDRLPAELLSARAWPTRVPLDVLARITGEPVLPDALRGYVADGALTYLCNAELSYRIGRVAVKASCRWDLAPAPGGGDTHAAVARGTRAEIQAEQSVRTGNRRRVFVAPVGDGEAVGRALRATIEAAARELPGLAVTREPAGRYEVIIPPGLDAGHESHFALVLDDLLGIADRGDWPEAAAARTLTKYTLLAAAAARVRDGRG